MNLGRISRMGSKHAGLKSAATQNRRALSIVFVLTFAYLLAEVAGGILTGSLALLADAGHMLGDVAGVGLSLFAVWLSAKPPSSEKSFGYYRAEILAAAANAVLLLFVSGFIFYEAYHRLVEPQEVITLPMLIIAGIGLLVNVAGMLLLHGGSKESLNIRGAFLEVTSDALASVGVIISGVVMMTTGWYYADPIAGLLIAFFILPRTWHLMSQAVNILMEGTPEHVDLEEVRKEMTGVEGVRLVHDLHVWTITSGVYAMSGHIVLEQDMAVKDSQAILQRINQNLRKRFHIEHTTIQIEYSDICKEKSSFCKEEPGG